MKKTILYGVAVCSVLVLGITIGRGLTPEAGAGGVGEAGAGQTFLTVSVIAAQQRAIPDRIDVVGVLVPRENVLAMPELSGRRILSVNADVGDYVQRGQLLATLDGEDLHIDIRGLTSEYERTRDEHARASTLQSSQLVSREFLKQKQASLDQARAQLDDARLRAGRTRVLAPASGLIYQRSAAIGGLTAEDMPLFSIVEQGKIEMQASVPEAMAYRLVQGMSVEVRLGGRPAPLEGRVRLIAPQVGGASRATEVRIALPEGTNASVGTFVEARIAIGEVAGWVVPAMALQQDTLGPYLWQVDAKDQVRRVPVTVLMQTPEDVVVREALGGLRIVGKAGALLQDQDTVSVAASGKAS